MCQATFMVCLFGGELGRMENFREKMRRKTFLVGVCLEGGKGKKLVGSRCFLSRLLKMFFLQNREKIEWEEFDR